MTKKICPICDKPITPFDLQTNYGKDDEKGSFYDPVHSACLNFNIKYIQNWIKKKVVEAGARGVVVGLSGGIDSSVTAALCNGVVDTLGLIMPCNSNGDDLDDAKMLADKFNIDYEAIPLGDFHSAMIERMNRIMPETGDTKKMADANLKARFRMCALYYVANATNRLVMGTSNKTEILLGYYTKGGDGMVDFEPIGDLYKTQVKIIAKELGIPDKIIDKPPSAGLWKGQTDEKELGMPYDNIDGIFMRVDNTEHKKFMPEVCKL